MPLLKKRTLEKAPMPEFLRDDEEVFHCEMTNEIFRDYEEFAERTILCNSMVWTCSMTGKSNLTYEEALQSEKDSRRTLEDFPNELKVPVLFVANETKRNAFSEMAEDVYFYVKDRYFIGEIIEACFASIWNKYQVVQVIAPTPDEVRSYKDDKIPASSYKYNLEQMNPEDEDIVEKMMAGMPQIRRIRLQFSQSKCKLFLKQHVAQVSEGHFVIKPSSLETFGILRTKFSDIFDGPLPSFNKSTKPRKVRQETLAKFLSKNNIAPFPPKLATMKPVDNTKKLLEREKEKERRMKDREALKQKNFELSLMRREWNVPKEDLLLEDQKKFPKLVPVTCKIPDKLLGDAVCVMEFLNNFSTVLNTKNYFSGGITLAIMERALTENKVAGPLIEIIILLLDALFNFQDEDTKSNVSKLEMDLLSRKEFKKLQEATSIGPGEAIKLATRSAVWTRKYQGFELYNIPFTLVSVSEILRLHLLSSGARYIDNHAAKMRYFCRGGFNSEDDPAIDFRLHNSYILKQLTIHNVVELSIGDKLKLLNCLVGQLLTSRQIRDVIYDNREIIKDYNLDLKQKQIFERKRHQELDTDISKLRKQALEEKLQLSSTEYKKLVEEMNSKIETLRNSCKEAIDENEVEIKTLKTVYANTITDLGYDRAFRRYTKIKSIPALLVNHNDENVGICLNEPIDNIPELVGGDDAAILNHLRKISEEINTSDKENEPKEKTVKVNGHSHVQNQSNTSTSERLMCSGDPSTCIVHSTSAPDSTWFFVDSEDTFNELVDSLNKRGLRESKLQSNLKISSEILSELISRTSKATLQGEEPVYVQSARKIEKENLGYPENMTPNEILCRALIDAFLDCEANLCGGNLGGMPNAIRDTWRTNLDKKLFDDIIVQANGIKPVGLKEEDDDDDGTREYQDPINYVNVMMTDIESEDSDLDSGGAIVLVQSEDDKTNIKGLATALLQLARSVKPAYLCKPLGIQSRKSVSNGLDRSNILHKWETSLINSTSYSQICVHYGTLDHCVLWGRSALRMNCRSCRKGANRELLLICDNCNSGLHTYCARPKLTEVPTGDWYCPRCTQEKKEVKEKKIEPMEDEQIEEEEEDEVEYAEEEPGICSVCKDVENGEVLRCYDCQILYHLECYTPPLRRLPRGKWYCLRCSKKRITQDRDSREFNGAVDDSLRRSNRIRDEAKTNLPLHNVALQEMLIEVMKHEDAWAFITPVQKRDVPDYYEVISKPMDFGTIKYKLNMGEYKYDEELMIDVQLVFDNCNMYNSSNDEVYQCGKRLLKYFMKSCKKLGLKTPKIQDFEDDEEPESKKMRTK